MNLKELLTPSFATGEFTIAKARELIGHDWRSIIKTLPDDLRREAETFFYFTEGFVEEFDEGFVDGNGDAELAKRATALISKLEEIH